MGSIHRFASYPARTFIWQLQNSLAGGESTRRLVGSASEDKSEKVPAKDEALPFEHIPGPKSSRFFGTLPKYLPIIGEYSMDALHRNGSLNYRRYGRLVRERITPSVSLVHVFDPRDMEAVFRSEGRLPERRSHLALLHYRTRKPLVYNTGGLLSTNGPEWWRLRSTFQKNFSSPQSVRGYVGTTDVIVQEFVEWVRHARARGDVDDFLPYLNRLFLEVIVAVAFDIRLKSFSREEQDPRSRSSKLIRAAFDSNSGILKLDHGFLWRYIRTPLYRKMSRSQAYLEQFASSLLADKLRFFEGAISEGKGADVVTEGATVAKGEEPSGAGQPRSLLDSFLLQPAVDTRDLLGMMVDILMAAVDTTSYSTSFLLYHVSRCERSQRALAAEAARGEAASGAPYARACVRESLRLNPVSVGVGRVLQRDVVLSGYRVPKGTIIVTQNMVASRLPEYCPDPLQFKPDRWLRDGDSHDSIHPFLSLPFGFGPRACIARRLAEQTMCIALIKIVRNFHLEWCGGEMDIKTLLINKPDAPVYIKMRNRND